MEWAMATGMATVDRAEAGRHALAMTQQDDAAREMEIRRTPGDGRPVSDWIATEEPLSIEVDGAPLAVLMRTPGHERSLIAGFLLSEGIIESRADFQAIEPCQNPERDNRGNRWQVVLSPGVGGPAMEALRRKTVTTAACGICGTTTMEAALAVAGPLEFDDGPDNPMPALPQSLIDAAFQAAKSHQPLFDKTGGIHGAMLLDSKGNLLASAEDIGRHNAVDKVIGTQVLADRIPADGTVLWVSGRASFEMVQKALAARIPTLIAVGAPTTLAVNLAREANLTLVAFARSPKRYNIYNGTVDSEAS